MRNRIRFPMLFQDCMRSTAIAEEPGMADEVTQVYIHVLAPVAANYCAGHNAMVAAQTKAAKKKAVKEERVVL